MGSKLVDGTIDSLLFKEFLEEVVKTVRQHMDSKDKDVVILLDNARVHTHQSVVDLAE